MMNSKKKSNLSIIGKCVGKTFLLGLVSAATIGSIIGGGYAAKSMTDSVDDIFS
jgi:hypothetical protein